MSCPDCSSITPLIFDVQSFISNSCLECQQQNCLPVKYLCYTGPDLACSGIETGDTLEEALQKLDTQVCSALGDYSTYQFNCLTAWWGDPITTEADFVDAITGYACELSDSITVFTNTTFPDYQNEVNNRVDDLEDPSITCASAGVTSGDNLVQILQKYCTKFGEIDDALDLTGVSWNACFTVITPPDTLTEAFNLLANQICSVKTIAEEAAVLPVFNNTGNCLSGGSDDTLVVTIGLMIDKLCEDFPFDAGDVDWGCVDDDGAEDLQEAFQALTNQVSSNMSILITDVSADFTLSLTDVMDPCAGMTLGLATPLVNNDRLVASNVSDLFPGTLIDKLAGGTNVTLDDITIPGQVIINVDNDHLLLAGPGDGTPGVLIDKVNGSNSNGVTITPAYNAFTEQVDLGLSVDLSTLAPALLTYISGNPEVLAQFCAMVSSCAACASYLYDIFNDSGISQLVSWLVCGSDIPITILLADGDTIQVCAREGSVSEVEDVTVTVAGICVSSPTTTTTTTTAAP